MADGRDFLRHVLATLAYRGSKAVRGAPPGFGLFRAGPTTRTPVEILAHVGDLLDWALAMARGEEAWNDSAPLAWDDEVVRFHRTLVAFDQFLTGTAPLRAEPERLLQGPLADALTHVGQLALLRRMAGLPVRGENYARADIAPGRVGPEQAAPVREFD